ncbi:WhiB family transcriptional regulator [Streptomyces sp. NPDC006872]|uniref:WhiB family transcriptional regulator n=1 Tax=Streptomyces sp. NPDC006872 TaxID=3155720 RepID=UPI0033F9D4B7
MSVGSKSFRLAQCKHQNRKNLVAYEGSIRPRSRGDQTWQERAACVGAVEVAMDPDLYFPEKSADERRIADAKRICSSCPVREMCLDAALESGDFCGIRGGMTVNERRAAWHQFELRCDPARVEAALTGRDVYLSRTERQTLIRWVAMAGTSTPRLAAVLKVSEAHVGKLLRMERRNLKGSSGQRAEDYPRASAEAILA